MRWLLAFCAWALPQESETERILAEFRSARPAETQLGLFRHDWAPTFEAAKKRAAAERRPVFLVAVQNLNGYDNLYTGHC